MDELVGQIGSVLSERFIEFLALVLTVMSGEAIRRLTVWLGSRHKIELTDAQQRKLKELTAEAIDYVEEWAHQQRKDGKEVSSDEKRAKGADYINSHAKDYALGVEVKNGDAENRIHAELGRRRSIAPPSPNGD